MRTKTSHAYAMLTALAVSLLGATLLYAQNEPEKAVTIPAPHPQITEVLFNVPNSDGHGDANKDGKRDAAGDEFIEIANAHPDPINLKGYTLTNRLAAHVLPPGHSGRGVRFEFPELILEPGDVAVIFNGYGWDAPAEVGDSENAPTRARPLMGRAWVFTMRGISPTSTLRNSGDYVLLTAPDGTPIDCVWWGKCDPKPPANALRVQEVRAEGRGSVQRVRPDTKLRPHPEIDLSMYSPGYIPAGRSR